MIEWGAAGLDTSVFWNSTPREMELSFKAAALRRRRDHNDRAWLAFHIAAFQRVKKIPKLDKLMIKERIVQPWHEQMAIMDAWASAIEAKRVN
jgi:hypothetical protein